VPEEAGADERCGAESPEDESEGAAGASSATAAGAGDATVLGAGLDGLERRGGVRCRGVRRAPMGAGLLRCGAGCAVRRGAATWRTGAAGARLL
jgi:hypothetical protein